LLQYNIVHMDKTVTFRYAGGAAGVPVGTPRAAVEIHQDAVDGPLLTTVTLTATSSNNTYTSQTFPPVSRAPTGSSSCSGRSREDRRRASATSTGSGSAAREPG
jgi:hypothetical protein